MRSVLILLLAFTLTAVPLLGAKGWAQTEWDAQQYATWVMEGRELYEQAQQLPRDAAQRRQELLLQSAQLKLAARELLQNALVTGSLSPEVADQAIGELYNLGENLIVTMLELDQCEAAMMLLGQMEREVALAPPDGLEHLQLVHPLVDQCRQRVVEAAAPWEEQRFLRLTEEARGLREESQGDADALMESVGKRMEALDLLRSALFSGVEIGRVSAPDQALFDLYDSLITDLVDLGFCGMAARRLALRDRDAQLLRPDSTGGEVALSDRVRTCSGRAQRAALTPQPQQVRIRQRRDPWPYVLLFTSAAAGLAGLAIDLSYEGDRASFDQVEQECAVGDCDYQRGLRLASSIDQSRWAARGMAATAIVAGIIGVVWLIAGGGTDEEVQPQAWLGPLWEGSGFGLSVTLSH
ncbi:MAG: hypothetical protein JW797_05195 [Bradymonadales bacterium]|nr:hypothetical protein [Bradymonadales bacterium]